MFKGTLVAVARPISHTSDVYKLNVVSQPPQVPPPHGKSYEPTAFVHSFSTEATNNGYSTTASKPSVNSIPLSSQTTLSDLGKHRIYQVLHDRRKAFVGPNGQLGKCELYEVKLQLKEGAKPFR